MAVFTDLEIPDDRDSIADTQVEYFQAQLPGWQPNAGDVETVLVEANSEQQSETRLLLKDYHRTATADLGTSVLGVPRVDSTQASGDTTWVVVDTVGYTIPSGTAIDVNGLLFVTTSDVTIPAGSSSTGVGEVPILAVEAGSQGTGLTGTASLIDTTIGFVVDSITIEGTTAGGEDGETREDYLDRFVDIATTFTQSPVVPANTETLLRRLVPGVDRALALDLLQPGTNEKQTVTITGAPTGGTFTLTFGGQTTAAIAYNATAATVRSRLEALSSIGVANVIVTGGPLPGALLTVEFVGTLAETNVAQLTATSSLTGGTSPAVTVATPIAGVAAQTNVARWHTVAIQGADGLPVPGTVKTQADALLQSKREVNFNFSVIDPTYLTVDVTVQVRCYPGWDTTSVQAGTTAAIQAFLDPSQWGLPPTGEAKLWINKTKVYGTDLIAAIENTPGVDHIEPGTLSYGKHGTTLVTTGDITLPGHAPLPLAGTITVTALAP